MNWQQYLRELQRMRNEEDQDTELAELYRNVPDTELQKRLGEVEATLEALKHDFPDWDIASGPVSREIRSLGTEREGISATLARRKRHASVALDQMRPSCSEPEKQQPPHSQAASANRAEPSLAQQSIETPKSEENRKSKSTDNRKMVDSYIEEVRQKTGKRITRKSIWKRAGYRSRTEFERWERQDSNRPNKTADDSFRRILLIEKPDLK